MNDKELDQRIASVFRVRTDSSEELRARIQSLHSYRADRRSTQNVRLRKVSIGLVVTMVLTSGILVYPRVIKPVSAAASVRQALAKVNTWHLKGWKMQDGNRVAWEVWGRREPFFYREQIGGDIVLDDGRQRLSIYGPSREGNQLSGICLRHPSLRGADNVPWSYNQMVEQWRDAGKPWKQTAQGPVFNFNAVNMEGYGVNTDNLYSIDGRTWLPTRYEKRIYNRAQDKSRRTVALLDADYESAIPLSVSAASSPPGYRVYDALSPAQGLPKDGATTASGFTLQCQPLAVATDGSILIQLRGWLGSTIVAAGQGDVHFQADSERWASMHAMDPPVNYDEQGRAYVGVRWDSLVWGNPDRNVYLMLFVPREPLAAHAALPTKLTAKFDAGVGAGWGLQGHNLIREDISVSVSLPKPGRSIIQAIAPYADPDGRPRSNNVISYGGYENLETAICVARARDYGDHADFRKLDTPEMHRSVYWMERAIGAADSLDVQLWREGLANTYQALGDFTNSRRLLRDILHEKRFLKLQALPPDRSPAGIAKAAGELRKGNQRYFDQARKMLSEIDKGKAN